MKILVLAPHPFYQPRGTPIAVDLLVRALSERGDEVHVLAFHEGSNRVYDRVQIHRIRPFIDVRRVRPGLSIKKLFCDVHLFFRFVSLVRKGRYDMVHAVEESSFMAMVICSMMSKPYVYDMDSSMTTQVVNKMRFLAPLGGVLRFIESLPMRYAEAVVPVCDELANDAFCAGAKNVVVLKDISLIRSMDGCSSVPENGCDILREELSLPSKIVMYIGNLEPYQGIDLLLESFALVRLKTDAAALVIIGGCERDIQKYRLAAEHLGIERSVHFLGYRPVENLMHYMSQSDVLVSPRTIGVNTPMKIYSYLDSGVPVLATDLPTHRQVVNRSMAMLAPPEKNAFAEAMIRLLSDETLCRRLADQARRFIEQEHSYSSFKTTVHRLYDYLEQKAAGQ
jgi:glycosyltransferase involved in cell wall biosynthesis